MIIHFISCYVVIPSFGGGVGQFGSLGVSWNTALPQHLSSSSSSSVDSAPNQVPVTTAPAASEDVATPSGSSHHEDDLGKLVQGCAVPFLVFLSMHVRFYESERDSERRGRESICTKSEPALIFRV